MKTKTSEDSGPQSLLQGITWEYVRNSEKKVLPLIESKIPGLEPAYYILTSPKCDSDTG